MPDDPKSQPFVEYDAVMSSDEGVQRWVSKIVSFDPTLERFIAELDRTHSS